MSISNATISNRTLIICGPARTIQKGKMLRVIDDHDWEKFIVPILFPFWDSDKDALVNFTYNDQPNEYCFVEKKKYVRNHTTGEYFWKQYIFTEYTPEQLETFLKEIREAVDAVASIEKQDLDDRVNRILAKEKGITMTRVKSWRNFFLETCDWTMLEDAPITPEEKEQWKIYRQKIRELPDKFTSNVNRLQSISVPIDPQVYRKNYLPYNPEEEYLATENQYVVFPDKGDDNAPGGALETVMLNYIRLCVQMSRPAPLFNVPSASYLTDPVDILIQEIEREQKLLDELRELQQNDDTTS